MVGDSKNGAQNDIINNLTKGSDSTEVVLLTYHTSFDGDDALNLKNPSEPASRALYYGISTSPKVMIDGVISSRESDNSSMFNNWLSKEFGLRTLQIAPFGINLSATKITYPDKRDPKIQILADVNAREDIDASFVVHIAIVEKEIIDSDIDGIIETGETVFYNTVRTMLPNAAGTRFLNSLSKGESVSVEALWNPTNVLLPNSNITELQVIVFVQNEVTGEILQAASVNYSDDIVLALDEELNNKGVALYPNPADRQITIKLATRSTREERAIIFDNTGKQIEELRLNVGQDIIELNTLDYRPGIYLFTLSTDAGAVMKRFVISHR